MDIIKKNVLYLVASPFQFYAAILDFYENEEYDNVYMIVFRFKNDENDYFNILRKLGFDKNISYKEINVPIISMLKKEMFLEKIYKKFILVNSYIKIIREILKFLDNISFSIVKVGEREFFLYYILLKFLNIDKVFYLGDGCSLIFEKDRKIHFSKFKNIILNMLGVVRPNEILLNNSNFFNYEWKFIKDFYSNLPLKDEIWIFGNSNYFLVPSKEYDYSKYVKDAIKKGKAYNKQCYFDYLKKIKTKYEKYNIIYFKHRNEPEFEFIKNLFSYSNYKYFAEVLPIMLGYMPKIIITSTTTLFSFSNIKKITKQNFILSYFSTDSIVDSIYKQYNAISIDELLKDENN